MVIHYCVQSVGSPDLRNKFLGLQVLASPEGLGVEPAHHDVVETVPGVIERGQKC